MRCGLCLAICHSDCVELWGWRLSENPASIGQPHFQVSGIESQVRLVTRKKAVRAQVHTSVQLGRTPVEVDSFWFRSCPGIDLLIYRAENSVWATPTSGATVRGSGCTLSGVRRMTRTEMRNRTGQPTCCRHVRSRTDAIPPATRPVKKTTRPGSSYIRPNSRTLRPQPKRPI